MPSRFHQHILIALALLILAALACSLPQTAGSQPTSLPLAPTASLENAGGKGLNLARLIQAGFPVPDGFLIPVAAYHQFIEQNGLDSKISSALAGASFEGLSSLEDLSRTIRGWFSQGKIPQDLEAAIMEGATMVRIGTAIFGKRG